MVFEQPSEACFGGFQEFCGAFVAHGFGEFVLAGSVRELYDVRVFYFFAAAFCYFICEALDISRNIRIVVVGI